MPLALELPRHRIAEYLTRCITGEVIEWGCCPRRNVSSSPAGPDRIAVVARIAAAEWFAVAARFVRLAGIACYRRHRDAFSGRACRDRYRGRPADCLNWRFHRHSVRSASLWTLASR